MWHHLIFLKLHITNFFKQIPIWFHYIYLSTLTKTWIVTCELLEGKLTRHKRFYIIHCSVVNVFGWSLSKRQVDECFVNGIGSVCQNLLRLLVIGNWIGNVKGYVCDQIIHPQLWSSKCTETCHWHGRFSGFNFYKGIEFVFTNGRFGIIVLNLFLLTSKLVFLIQKLLVQ